MIKKLFAPFGTPSFSTVSVTYASVSERISIRGTFVQFISVAFHAPSAGGTGCIPVLQRINLSGSPFPSSTLFSGMLLLLCVFRN